MTTIDSRLSANNVLIAGRPAPGEFRVLHRIRLWRTFIRLDREGRDVLLSALVLSILFALRSWFLAWRIGGRLVISNLLIDVTMLVGLVIALRLFDAGIRWLVDRLLGAARRRHRLAADSLRFAVVGLFTLPVVMVFVQFSLPRIECTGTPANIGLAFEDVSFTCKSDTIPGWFVPSSAQNAPVVLVAHGMGVNKQTLLPVVKAVHELGYHALVFDFRAHGNNCSREITTFGYCEADDVKSAYDWIVKRFPGRPVYAFGSSMGGAAVLRAAAQHHIFDKIIVDSGFARAETVGCTKYLGWTGPLAPQLWNMGRFWGWLLSGSDLGENNPEQWIAKIKNCPLMLIHGTDDIVTPISEATHLVAACAQRPEFWVIPHVGHVGAVFHPEFKSRIANFLAPDTSRLAGRR